MRNALQHLALLACFAYIGCLLANFVGPDDEALTYGTCHAADSHTPESACE